MKRNEPVRHIMSSDVVTLHLGQRPSEAHHILAEGHIHHVPIVRGKELVGLITASDMLRLNFEAYGRADTDVFNTYLDHNFTLADIMRSEVTTLRHDDTVRRAAELLNTGSFHSLPVVDDNGELVGIVTTTDLISYLLDQY